MSEVKVNKISPRTNCGTVQLGDSGDTITIPAGATITNNGTQTGFGRTGAVDWQTGSIKTSTFTAVSGEGYFVDTSSGAVTANLPAGSAGAIVAFSDYTRTFATNALTIVPNGSNKIGGVAANLSLNVNGQATTLVYVDGTEGWINVQNAEDTQTGLAPAYIAATGGTVTTVCTNFKVHTFTGPGTFCVSSAGNSAGSNTVEYLVVAGGGSGGAANGGGGGGGAGGFRVANISMPAPQTSPLATTGFPVSATAFPITVGGGGSAISGPGPSPGSAIGNDGNPSVFSTITSTAGGGGGGAGSNSSGRPGGSGGGEGGQAASGSPGNGNTPPVSPPQGNPGGDTNPSIETNQGSGGGGASAAGSGNGPPSSKAGDGGAGSFVVQTGFAGCNGTPGPVSGARYFAGGGGGNSESHPATCQGQGGAGGGGAGGISGSSATNGGTNTGGGGGGIDASPAGNNSGAGGSGIVIIRYKFQG